MAVTNIRKVVLIYSLSSSYLHSEYTMSLQKERVELKNVILMEIQLYNNMFQVQLWVLTIITLKYG